LIEVFVTKNWDGFSAYFVDSQGYKTIFTGRNVFKHLEESILEHFDVLKKDFIIKKE
jgi:hypothetical protein